MTPETLAARLDEVQVLDVRYAGEWEAGRIEGARHVPVDELAERIDELDHDRVFVTVCRSGDRSAWAADWLRGEGFDAESLDGGMQAWAEAGLPLHDAHGGQGTVAEPEPPVDDRPEELRRLQESFLELVFAVHDRFGDREPSEDELRAFLRERLLAEGRSPEEADAFLAELDRQASD